MTSMGFPFKLDVQWQVLQNMSPEHVINHPWIKAQFIDRENLDIRGMDQETSRVVNHPDHLFDLRTSREGSKNQRAAPESALVSTKPVVDAIVPKPGPPKPAGGLSMSHHAVLNAQGSSSSPRPNLPIKPVLPARPRSPDPLTKLADVPNEELPQDVDELPEFRADFFKHWYKEVLSGLPSEYHIRDVSRRARPGKIPQHALNARPTDHYTEQFRLFPLSYNEACSPTLGGMLPTKWRAGWTTKDLQTLPRADFYWIDLPLYNPEWREKCPLAWILLEEWLDFNIRVREFLPYN